MAVIRLYTRVGCHLCEEALRIIHATVGPADVVELIDIDANPAITDDYTIRVPVVEVDGVEIAQYQVDPDTLQRAL